MLNDCPIKFVRLPLNNMIAFLKELVVMCISLIACVSKYHCIKNSFYPIMGTTILLKHQSLMTIYILMYFTSGYRVVVICSLEDEERAHVVSKLHQYRREYPPLPPTTDIASYLKKHFVTVNHDSAAMVDPEMYNKILIMSFVHVCFI